MTDSSSEGGHHHTVIKFTQVSTVAAGASQLPEAGSLLLVIPRVQNSISSRRVQKQTGRQEEFASAGLANAGCRKLGIHHNASRNHCVRVDLCWVSKTGNTATATMAFHCQRQQDVSGGEQNSYWKVPCLVNYANSSDESVYV